MPDLIDHPSSIRDPQPAFRVTDLVITRGTTRILDRLSAHAPRGHAVALLGPNGCGKTTLARTLTGHLFPTHGSVEVLGQPLGNCDVRALRRRIGVVNPTLSTSDQHAAGATVDADLTATQAVCTGYFATVGLYDRPTTTQTDHARHLLTTVGLSHRLDHRVATLSTGELRRALIARALVHTPELLILDEPTAGLDIAGRESVLATVDHLLTQRSAPSVLLITHHVEELSRHTSHVMLMRNGQLLAQGPPRTTITPERLTQTFGCKVYVHQTPHGRYWLEVLPEAWLDLARSCG